MPALDISSIINQVNGSPLVFQEVIDQGGEAIGADEYFSNGLVTEFKYSVEIGNVFRNGSLAWLSNFGEAWGFMPSYKAVVFVDNHDNQRGHGGGGIAPLDSAYGRDLGSRSARGDPDARRSQQSSGSRC